MTGYERYEAYTDDEWSPYLLGREPRWTTQYDDDDPVNDPMDWDGEE